MLLLRQAELENLSNESSVTSSDSEKSSSKYNRPRNGSQHSCKSISSRNFYHHYYAIKRKNNLNKYKQNMIHNNEINQIKISQEDQEPIKHLPKIFTQAKNLIRLFSGSGNKDNQIDSKKNEINNNKIKSDDKLNLKSKRLAKLILNQQQKFQLDSNKNHRIPFITTYLSTRSNESKNQKEKKMTSNFKSIQITLDRLDSVSANSSNQIISMNYGFTVTGYCPCQIGKVDKDSIAENAGLLPGDLIIKINGKNVSRATCYSIVKIIKSKSNQRLSLDLYRCANKTDIKTYVKNNHDDFDNKNCIGGVLLKKSSFSSSIDRDLYKIKSSTSNYVINSTEYSNDPINNLNSSNNLKKKNSFITPKIINKNSEFKKRYSVRTRISQQYCDDSNNDLKKSLNLYQKKNSLNVDTLYQDNRIKKSKIVHSNENKLAYEFTSNKDESIKKTINNKNHAEKELNKINMHAKIGFLPSPIPFLSPIQQTNNKTNMNTIFNDSHNYAIEDEDEAVDIKFDENHYHYSKSNLKEMKKSSITDSDYKTQSSATDNDIATVYSSLSNLYKKQTSNQLINQFDVDNEHIVFCEKLLNLEEKFIELMQKGVQQYSRPLRHCLMISPIQHQTLFQNIEKILAISEYQLNQLISQDDSTLINMFITIGKLYENKMRMSCEAFDLYLNGIDKSFQLLTCLMNSNQESTANQSAPNFSKFLFDSQDDIEMDLKTFLLLPLYYVGDIYLCLKKIQKTLKASEDDIYLSNLLSNLKIYVTKSSKMLKEYNNGENKNPLSNLNYFESFNKSKDDISVNKIKLIYSSSIQLRQSSHKWKKCKLLLLSDRIVLISRQINPKEYVKHLNLSACLKQVTFKTIYLNAVVDYEFLKNKMEFRMDYHDNYFIDKLSTIKLKIDTNEKRLKLKQLFQIYLIN